MATSRASHMQRTLEALRDAGYVADKTEQWIQYASTDPRRRIRPGERKDLFGWIDAIALRPGEILAVQVCGSDVSAHIKKIKDKREEAFMSWLAAGGKAEIWGWRKVKKARGGKAMVWKPRKLIWSMHFNKWEDG